MAKSSNPSKGTSPSEASAVGSTAGAESGVSAMLSENVGPAKLIKTAAKTGRKGPAAKARKTTAGDKPRKPSARKKATPAEIAIADDDIRLRAYFIAERRAQSGLAGDSASDWLEARRQLLEEAAKSA